MAQGEGAVKFIARLHTAGFGRRLKAKFVKLVLQIVGVNIVEVPGSDVVIGDNSRISQLEGADSDREKGKLLIDAIKAVSARLNA